MTEASGHTSQTAGADSCIAGERSATRRRHQLRVSGRRRWIFRAFAVALSLVLLCFVEILLRVFGVGEDLSLVRPVPDARHTLRFQINPVADRVWCPGQGMAGPEPRRFDLPEPKGVFRIVVVGASTVQGFPYASELAFPRQLEVLLNLQQAKQKVEVLNLGVTGISTSVVAEILSESLTLEPDLLVVHAGHNEFYGIGGVASTIGAMPRLLNQVAATARSTRIGQALGRLVPSGVPSDRDPIEVLPADLEISFRSELFLAAEAAYRQNLQAMVKMARNAGVPIILSTVAANHRGHSPVGGFLPGGLTDRELSQWRSAFDEGRRLAANEDFAAAVAQLEIAQGIDESSSLLQYRRAECLLALERISEADDAFRVAADLDGCRFRAPSTFSQILSHVVTETNDSNVVLVDTEDAIGETVRRGGRRQDELPIFLEHVHFSRRGHGVLAEKLGRTILHEFLGVDWNESITVDSAMFRDELGVLVEDDLAALSFALELYNREPMRRAFDAQRHRQNLLQEISVRFAGLSRKSQDVFSAMTLEQMAEDLPVYLADQIEQTGDRQRLLDVLRKGVLRQPWSISRRHRLIQALQSGSGAVGDEAVELKRQLLHCHDLSTGIESI